LQRGGKKVLQQKCLFFKTEEEEERSKFNALSRACKEIITEAKMQEAAEDRNKKFIFQRYWREEVMVTFAAILIGSQNEVLAAIYCPGQTCPNKHAIKTLL